MTRRSLTQAVAKAALLAPASPRALALAASVPPSTLCRIGKGEREATEAVAESVAAALRRWSRDCELLAERIEHALPERRT
jgi:hypothetical protein